MKVATPRCLCVGAEWRSPKLLGDEVNDPLRRLDPPGDAEDAAGASEEAVSLVDLTPYDDVDEARLVLKRIEGDPAGA